MSDSPKDPELLKLGKIVNTYKVWGMGNNVVFKSQETGKLFHKNEFDEIDFNWKKNPTAWEKKYGIKLDGKK